MKKYFIVLLLVVLNDIDCWSQQTIIYVHNPSAMSVRGVAIPGQLFSTSSLKIALANTTLPALLEAHITRLKTKSLTVLGNLNALVLLLYYCSEFENKILSLISDLDSLERNVLNYLPGYITLKTKFLRAEISLNLTRKNYGILAGYSLFFIGGSGYVGVSAQNLANSFIFIYKDLRDIHFKMEVLKSFVSVIRKSI